MSKFKPQKTISKKSGSKIQKDDKLLNELSNERIAYSYKYLDLNHKKFNLESSEIDKGYFIKLKERFKKLSDINYKEFTSGKYTHSCHSHDIKWEKTTEINFGISGEEQIVDIPWQFSISVNEYGRVHGFFIDNIFFIVWLDYYHRLCP